jgi:hypothetical protein
MMKQESFEKHGEETFKETHPILCQTTKRTEKAKKLENRPSSVSVECTEGLENRPRLILAK